MRHAKNQIQRGEAFNEFLSKIEPLQAEKTIHDAFMNYITSDNYCGMPQSDRDQDVFVLQSLVNLFRNISNAKDPELD